MTTSWPSQPTGDRREKRGDTEAIRANRQASEVRAMSLAIDSNPMPIAAPRSTTEISPAIGHSTP
jgi:hypothetical protein